MMELSIKKTAELKLLTEEYLAKDEFSEELFSALMADKRRSVQSLGERYKKQFQKMIMEKDRIQELYYYEHRIRKQGYRFIAGIDEAGRGPLAGPVVAAAVILPIDCFIPGLNDSKKMSAKKREELYDIIMAKAEAVGIGKAEPEEIDRINILQADYLAMLRAVDDMSLCPDYLLIDGNGSPKTKIAHAPLINGDSLSASIAAASIIAKVTRDREMDGFDKKYPQYQFAKHKGYGTAAHVAALEKYGVCPIHRRSFSLVAKYIY